MVNRQANKQHAVQSFFLTFQYQVQGSFSRIPQRYVLTFLTFLALLNAFAMRVNISIAITKMVRDPYPANATSDNNHNETVLRNQKTSDMNRFDDNDTQTNGTNEIELIPIVEQFEAYNVSDHLNGLNDF